MGPEDLAKTLLAEVLEPSERLRSSGNRLVHYTSSDAALKILESRSIFMRSATCMNDVAEVRHGIEALIGVLTTKKAETHFWSVLDNSFSGISDEIKGAFDRWRSDTEMETYIACLSEHPASEDDFGRLSMWRGYGGGPSVAIVIRPDAALGESQVLGAYTYPVIYKTLEEIEQMFDKKFDVIRAVGSLLGTLDRQFVLNQITWILDAFSYSLKHPAFKEEREWRVVYRPNKFPSKVLAESAISLGGVPQPVYKIPLQLLGEGGELDLSPNALIDRVIIGPTDAPYVQFRALVSALSAAGVERPEDRVFVSGVPYRDRVL